MKNISKMFSPLLMQRSLRVAFVGIVVLVGCGKTVEPTPTPVEVFTANRQDQLIPVVVGNSWEYRGSRGTIPSALEQFVILGVDAIDTGYIVYATPSTHLSAKRYEIATVRRYNSSVVGGGKSSSDYYAVFENGLFGNTPKQNGNLAFSNSWTLPYEPPMGDTVLKSQWTGTKIVTVPAGTFGCFEAKGDGKAYYFKRGVGFVKGVLYQNDGTPYDSVELVKYTVN